MGSSKSRLRQLLSHLFSAATMSRKQGNPFRSTQAEDAHSAALVRLGLAENEAEVDEAIGLEPRALSREDEQEARMLAAFLDHVGESELASIYTQAADHIADLLERLVRPEENPLVALTEQVLEGNLSLDEARAWVEHPEFRQRLRLAHLAALDDHVLRLTHKGNLARAELLATTNYTAARQIGHTKLLTDTALSLANIKAALGWHSEAIPLLEEAARLAEQMGDLKRLILAIGPLGDAYRDTGRYEQARRCYDRALKLARRLGAHNLEVAALGNLALLHIQTGNLRAADEISKQALHRARAMDDGLSREGRFQVAQSAGTRAFVLYLLGRLEESVALYRESADLLQQLGDASSSLDKRIGLANALAAWDKPDEAVKELEEVQHFAEWLSLSPVQVKALTLLGRIHLRRGDVDRALEALEQAQTVEDVLSPAERATFWLSKAELHLYLGQLVLAEQALEHASEQAAVLAQPRLEAIIALYRARLASYRGQWTACEESARQVLEQSRAGQQFDLELEALNLLGHACREQQRWKEAEEWYRRALKRAEAMRSPGATAWARLRLGMVWAAQGQLREAEVAMQDALKHARDLGSRPLQYFAHYHLGRLYADWMENLSKALEHFRAAIELLERERSTLAEIQTLERQHAAKRHEIYRLAANTALRLGQPWEALEFLEQGRARLLAQWVFLAEDLPPSVPDELKARYVQALQAVQALRRAVYGEPSWGARLLEEIRFAEAALGRAKDEETFRQIMAQVKKRNEEQQRLALARAEAELDEVLRAVRTHAPDFDVHWRLPSFRREDVVSDPATAVVALVAGRRTGTAILFHPSGIRMVDLPGLRKDEAERLLDGLPEPLAQAREEIRHMDREPLKAGVAASIMHYLILQEMISGEPLSQIGWQVALSALVVEAHTAIEREQVEAWLKKQDITVSSLSEKRPFELEVHELLSLWERVLHIVAEGLRQRLWAPLLPILREFGVTQVVLVPDADLHTLPLALGLDGEENPPAVTFAPSLRLYAHSVARRHRQASPEPSLLAVANPTGDLPSAEVEAVLLQRHFADRGLSTTVLSGEQATVEQLVVASAQRPTYWHFAGHARYTWWNPAESVLYLAKGERLSFLAIPATLDLRGVRLAVLSACETGMAPVRDPAQEFEGLFSAFLMAGAAAVLASLWPVEELATALLMYRFYQHLLGDPQEGLAPRAPAEALRDAQAWLRALTVEEVQRHPVVRMGRELYPTRNSWFWQQMLALEGRGRHPFRNPYFWAGFVLAGV